MENIKFTAKIRKGIIKGNSELTSDFLEFIKRCQGKVEVKNKPYNTYLLLPNEILFEFEEDLVLYQLTFDEIDPLKIILPIIRQNMPTIIANDIISVQNMSNTAEIFTLKYST